MAILVLHRSEPDFFNSDPNNTRGDSFHPVAEVHGDSLGVAFERTNHIHDAWWKNEDVILIRESRSTSVGDRMTDLTTNKTYVVDLIGFKEVNK
jgi:hypothetical protein